MKYSNVQIFKPRRGLYRNAFKVTLEPNELFYTTDLKMIGVASNNGEPELVASVDEYCCVEEFPQEGVAGKFYLDSSDGGLYTYDGEAYERIIVGHNMYGMPIKMNLK